jgi:hypothetical protein
LGNWDILVLKNLGRNTSMKRGSARLLVAVEAAWNRYHSGHVMKVGAGILVKQNAKINAASSLIPRLMEAIIVRRILSAVLVREIEFACKLDSGNPLRMKLWLTVRGSALT